MKKRLLSMILAISMVLTFLPVSAITAFAEDAGATSGDCGAGLTWTLSDDGTLTISGTGTMADYQYNQTPWDSVKTQIEKVKIESGATSIGKNAFNSFKKLKSITIPGTVESIGDCAFTGSGLTSITIPGSVKNMGTFMFYHCDSLETVTIENGVPYIGDSMFIWCGKLKNVQLPTSVQEIKKNAFQGCSNLESIVIPEGVKIIKESVFSGCSKLKSVTLPKSMSGGGFSPDVFANCNSLEKIIFNGTEAEWKSVNGQNNISSVIDKVYVNHTVTFMNGTSKLSTETVNYKIESKSVPAVTAPTGKYMTGWYKDKDCTQKFNLKQDTVKEDLTLYAGFATPELTVKDATVTVNGSETDAKEVPVDANVTVTFDDSTIADKNLVFGGWEIEGLSDNEIDKSAKRIEFTMPAGNVSVAATTKYPDQTVTVTNGTITATLNGKTLTDTELNIQKNGDTTTANVRSSAKVTVAFDRDAFAGKNLEFVSWNIQGLLDEECSSEKESVSFTMPNGKNMKLTAVTKLPGQNLVVTNGTVYATLNDAELSEDDMGLVKTGDTVTASVRAGASVTVTLDKDALAEQKQEFVSWSISGLEDDVEIDETAEKIEFIMPAEGTVTVKPVTRTPDQKLTVTNGTFTYKNADNEEVTGKTGEIPVGTEVTVTFDKDAFADSGLKFSYWNITGLSDEEAAKYNKQESFTFKMPANNVTLEAMTQDATIEDEGPDILGTAAIITTAAVGGAVLAWQGYQIGTELYLTYLLPAGAAIPANTAELAKLVWTEAGKPAPAAPLAEDATEEQQAMAWAVETGLIDADQPADASVSRTEVIKTWKKAQSVKKG